jgi:integrase
MGRPQNGIYRDKQGNWWVDRVYRGTRLRQSFGQNRKEAQSWLIHQLEQLRQSQLFGTRAKRTFDEAAAKYLLDHQDKVSIESDIYHLGRLMPYIGQCTLDQIHDGTLEAFVRDRKARGLANKTINLGLTLVRRMLNLAARSWRDEDGKTWLETPPLLTLLPLIGHQREPRPITWAEQRELVPRLPVHLARMVLFDLNTGVRDGVVCGLKWEWEIAVPELGVSVFDIPRESVKGRKRSRVLVCNTVAQSIIESVRGMHDEFVFVWTRGVKKVYVGGPVETMNNTAWQRARGEIGIPDLHIHDLRHTVGMRLREAEVREETIADILWHVRPGMTAHYSVAQVAELVDALNRITDERSRTNRSLAMIAREARGEKSPHKVPMQMKNG